MPGYLVFFITIVTLHEKIVNKMGSIIATVFYVIAMEVLYYNSISPWSISYSLQINSLFIYILSPYNQVSYFSNLLSSIDSRNFFGILIWYVLFISSYVAPPIQFNRIILSYFFGRGNVNWKLKNYCYCKADTVGKENLWIENDKKGRTDNEENNFCRNGRYLYQTWGLFYSKSYLIGGRRTESCRCMGTKTFILLLKYI